MMKDMQNVMNHLRNDQEYPATKAELVAQCDNLSDFSEEDKTWFEEHLEDKTYNSPEEVMMALGMKKEHVGQVV